MLARVRRKAEVHTGSCLSACTFVCFSPTLRWCVHEHDVNEKTGCAAAVKAPWRSAKRSKPWHADRLACATCNNCHGVPRLLFTLDTQYSHQMAPAATIKALQPPLRPWPPRPAGRGRAARFTAPASLFGAGGTMEEG